MSWLERRAPVVAAVLAAIAAFATSTGDPIGVFNDDGIYLLTAKAIAEGQGYVYPQLPGLPPAIHYPPAWPALLAIVWMVGPAFPDNVVLLKLLNPILVGCAAAGVVVAGRRLFGLPWWAALGVAVLATVSIPVLLLASFLLSEPLFLALLLPTLLTVERFVEHGDRRTGVLAALLTGVLILTRTLGGVVLIAGLVVLAWRRRWRDAAWYGAIAVAVLVPWQLYVWRSGAAFPPELQGSYGPYLEWVVRGWSDGGWRFITTSLSHNLGDALAFAGSMTVPYAPEAVRPVLGAVAIGVFLVLMGRLWTRGIAPVTLLALAGYVAVSLAWPFKVDRFLWAVWPLFWLVAAAGLHRAHARLRPRAPRAAVGALLAAGVLVIGHEAFVILGIRGGVLQETSREMTAYGVNLARAVNLEPRLKGRRLGTELAPLVALYTGATVVPLEILTPSQYLRRKTIPEHQREIEALDARFHPEAYAVLRGGPYLPALRQANLDRGRRLQEISDSSSFVRLFLVELP